MRAPTKSGCFTSLRSSDNFAYTKVGLMERKKRNVPPTFTGLIVVTFTPVKAFILLERLREDWCIGPHQSSSLPACTSTAPICVFT